MRALLQFTRDGLDTLSEEGLAWSVARAAGVELPLPSLPGTRTDDFKSPGAYRKELAMVDERVGKLARLLVDYSIQAGKGDGVLVSGEVGAGPLIGALSARLLQVGATPVTPDWLAGDAQEIFFQEAQELHYEEIPQITRAIYEGVDAQIGILSPSVRIALANVDPERQQAPSRSATSR